MSTTAWILLVVAAVVTVWVGVTFNAFVRYRNRVREAFSGVDVQLKRRHNLVPNLVRVVQAYAGHERETLERTAAARSDAAAANRVEDRARSENGLSRSLDRLIALVEAYPDLKADDNFRQLQRDLVEIEEEIQYARRYYNGTVRDYNNKIQQFPANLLAPVFGQRTEAFFEIESAAEREVPSVGHRQPVGERGNDR